MDEAKLWRALQERDRSFEGQFVYGVLTTGVFCRPGCASRTPSRRNVRFYTTAAQAQSDGLRPCLRCNPLEPRKPAGDALREQFRQVCSYIRRNLDDRSALKLDALAQRFGMSPFHFQRTFKSVVGLTPRQYAEAIRMQSLKENLRSESTVTDAIYESGFGASSRVYGAADANLGMTPRQYRRGGENVAISYVTAHTPLGLVMIGATDRGLCFLEFGNSPDELLESLQQEYPAAKFSPMPQPYSAEFTAWMQSLASYLEGERALAQTPIALHGTAFQVKVWRYLQTIAPGSVQSYTEVAKAIGHPKATRAVAKACGANHIALAIPCHRVIRGDGGLGGYRWGIERKRALLDAERHAAKSQG